MVTSWCTLHQDAHAEIDCPRRDASLKQNIAANSLLLLELPTNMAILSLLQVPATWLSGLVGKICGLLIALCVPPTGNPYSPPSTASHSDDTTSPIYPDRPIRPLPKRPLRSRLSPEAAENITCPAPPPTNNSIFQASYPENNHLSQDTEAGQVAAEIDRALIEAQRGYNGQSQRSYQFKGIGEEDSEDDEGHGLRRRYYEEHQQQALLAGSGSRPAPNGHVRAQDGNGQSTNSSNNSIDGYDSFENTNNKKKRKIPTSTTFGSLHNTLSAELANMGISYTREKESDHRIGESTNLHGASSSFATNSMNGGTGISGAGRGRYGRSGRRDTNGRSPLGVSTNGSNSSQLGLAYGREFNPQHGQDGKGICTTTPFCISTDQPSF